MISLDILQAEKNMFFELWQNKNAAFAEKMLLHEISGKIISLSL